ncbi:type II secretion system protein GspG, partial [Vibrio sp. FNV 38]|nr:type II secretion system protein GspG [Vibrio sp. FNV 38]
MYALNREEERRDAGFTLVEILMVVVIIGILAAVAIPNLGNAHEKALRNAAKASVSELNSAVERYHMDCLKYPDSLRELISSSAKGWEGPYIRKEESLIDPWGNEFHYSKNGNQYTI